MILHAVSVSAVFADTAAQAPNHIQCMQLPAAESWTKWLLQFALSIVPVAGGVGIALWSFRATSKRDHVRWILDQKKIEWKELLCIYDEIAEQWLPPYKKGDVLDTLIQRVQNAYGRLHGRTIKYIFIGQSIDQMSVRINEFVQVIGDGAERLESLRFGKRADIQIPEEYNNLRAAFHSFAWLTRNSAYVDLGIWKKSESGMIVPAERDKTLE